MRDRRQLWGWLIYDWANSAYVTTVAVAVLPAYFAAGVVPEGGLRLWGQTFSATTLWSIAVGLAALFLFALGPGLGAAADLSGRKKHFLGFFAYVGALAATLLWFTGPGDVALVMGLFVVAQVGFAGANVFYDAFLPHATRAAYGDAPGAMDRASGQGFAAGYLGGGLQFALSLAILSLHERLGLGQGQAARLVMVMAALWWAGFGALTMLWIKDPAPGERLGPLAFWRFTRAGYARVFHTLGRIRGQRGLLLFLLAFLCYNDGIQTVIYMATIYGKEELGFSTTTLMLTLLLIQFVAWFGALLFGRLAGRLGARRALSLSLVVWCGVAAYAAVLSRPWEYFLMGAVVGLVLGGSQALSRSLYARLIPRESPAEYFGFFSVVHRFSSVLGPFLFGAVSFLTGSARPAALSLLVLFVLGLLLLWRAPDGGEEER